MRIRVASLRASWEYREDGFKMGGINGELILDLDAEDTLRIAPHSDAPLCDAPQSKSSGQEA